MTQSPVRKRDRTRAALLDVALELFAEQGYDATTIDDIAAAAGVARQTVLNHYPRKEEFVLAWGTRRRERIEAKVPPHADGASARERVHEIYRVLADINEGERALTASLLAIGLAVHPQHPVPRIVVDAVSAGQAAGEFDDAVDPAVAGEVFAAVYFDVLSRWVADGSAPFLPMLEARLAVVLDGLVSTPARSGAAGSGRPRGRRSATTRRDTR